MKITDQLEHYEKESGHLKLPWKYGHCGPADDDEQFYDWFIKSADDIIIARGDATNHVVGHLIVAMRHALPAFILLAKAADAMLDEFYEISEEPQVYSALRMALKPFMDKMNG